MIKRVSLAEASEHLPELVEAAQRGDEVVIEDDKKNQVKLVTVPRATRKRRIVGLHEGQIDMRDDFIKPLPDDFWTGGMP